MKKIFALLLCMIIVIAAFASCSSGDTEEDKGPTIPVYLGTDIANFDPANANLDDAHAKILGLIYEGLYKYDANGKVVKAQAKSLKVLDKPDEDYYAIEIKLNKTAWSDGTLVQASDFIFAWKRILEPGFRGEAASLLFDIKNARECNSGERSIDDFGVTDSGTTVLKIEFEGPTDYDKFCEYLASPYLVPLRENAIGKVAKDWSSNQSIVSQSCNGPFCVRSFTPGEKLVLERNIYYMRKIGESVNDSSDSLTKYVMPYRLSIDLTEKQDGNTELFENGMLAYNSEIALDKRAQYKSTATVKDTMSVMSYIFNTNAAPFDNADVRLALSKAIDRNKIVEILTFAKPAEGLIASGVFNTGYSGKTTFRRAGKSLISADADLNEAKSLLSKANYSEKNIEISVRNNDADVKVAEYVKSVWDSLGFNVTIKKYSFKTYTDEKEYDLVQDKFIEDYDSRSFQVISVDYAMFCTDAFANLASFSKNFASGYIDMTVPADDYPLTTHISGYDSEAYDTLIENAYAEKNAAKRAEILHEAEELLMKDMPIMPLVQLQNASISDSNLKNKSGINYMGITLFQKAKLSDREKYTVETAN